MTKLLLIRHAQSAPAASISEEFWSLSEAGMVDANTLADTLAAQQIDKIYSSPYTRTKETVRPLAESRDLEINIELDLRERKLSDGLIDDWKAMIEQSWIGNAIALFINRLEPNFGFENWRAMRNPHVFELARTGGAWFIKD